MNALRGNEVSQKLGCMSNDAQHNTIQASQYRRECDYVITDEASDLLVDTQRSDVNKGEAGL